MNKHGRTLQTPMIKHGKPPLQKAKEQPLKQMLQSVIILSNPANVNENQNHNALPGFIHRSEVIPSLNDWMPKMAWAPNLGQKTMLILQPLTKSLRKMRVSLCIPMPSFAFIQDRPRACGFLIFFRRRSCAWCGPQWEDYGATALLDQSSGVCVCHLTQNLKN